MKDIAIAMITIDRSPLKNYLGETLENLKRAGVFSSPRFCGAHVCNSLPDGFTLREVRQHDVPVHALEHEHAVLSANRNVSMTLRVGALSKAEWVLFLEDDIDVCDKFLDSVGAWLDEHEDSVEYPLYAFGAAYDIVCKYHRMGKTAWTYPVTGFYGTQAFAVRPAVALDISKWLDEHEFDRTDNGTAYDISIHDWADARGYQYFLASVPSFVQHNGKQSFISPRPEDQVHAFASWPGREWSYQSKVEA